jgi:hypothetical protein
MIRRRAALALLVCVACASCGKKGADGHADAASSATPPVASAPPAASASAAAPSSAAAVGVPAGSPPPDGKYERVVVDGVTVPMIEIMNKGAVVLVDTDGKKPRSWEEQYKRKRDLPAGQFDVHKTNANKNDTFEDDAIDKEGLWVIDAKGNLTRR